MKRGLTRTPPITSKVTSDLISTSISCCWYRQELALLRLKSIIETLMLVTICLLAVTSVFAHPVSATILGNVFTLVFTT